MSEFEALQQIWGVILVCIAIFFLFLALWAGGCCAAEEEKEDEGRGAMRGKPLRLTTRTSIGWTHADHLRLARDRIPPTLLEPLRPIGRA